MDSQGGSGIPDPSVRNMLSVFIGNWVLPVSVPEGITPAGLGIDLGWISTPASRNVSPCIVIILGDRVCLWSFWRYRSHSRQATEFAWAKGSDCKIVAGGDAGLDITITNTSSNSSCSSLLTAMMRSRCGLGRFKPHSFGAIHDNTFDPLHRNDMT